MEEIAKIEEQPEFPLGAVLKHKSYGAVIIIDFAQPINNMVLDAKDYKRPICRYANFRTGKYETAIFNTFELEKFQNPDDALKSL